jgi:hypothetical protein
MGWSQQLDKTYGSRPRCVLFVEGGREEVAARLTQLVGLDDVVVTRDDKWKPWGKPVIIGEKWDSAPAKEVQLGGLTDLLSQKDGKRNWQEFRRQLKDWWIPKRGKTPTWDIASTCSVRGKTGLILVEAKAHKNEELSGSDKSGSNSPLNRERISSAIGEAVASLQSITGGSWDLSRDHHYQLSNRFAWSWKLASLGIPVVLVYLGFLNATDIDADGNRFRSLDHWDRVIRDHCDGVVDNTCWDCRLDVNGVSLFPLIRAVEQPFQPCEG